MVKRPRQYGAKPISKTGAAFLAQAYKPSAPAPKIETGPQDKPDAESIFDLLEDKG